MDRCGYGKDVHRTKCQTLTIARLLLYVVVLSVSTVVSILSIVILVVFIVVSILSIVL